MMPRARIPLSAPHVDDHGFEAVRLGIVAGEISLGEQVGAFEREFAAAIGRPHVAAVSSGTAALHLALRTVVVRPGEEVFCSTFSSSATANPIRYERGVPVFIDCEATSWNMDPARLEEALALRARSGRLPRAVIVSHVYGQPAGIDAIAAICERHAVPLIEDAAESLGAIYYDTGTGTPRTVGTRGWMGAYSFGDNKIISNSGGGMLASADGSAIAKAKRLRTPEPGLPSSDPHSQIGFEYQMNPVLAAIGRGQLRLLDGRNEARRRNFAFYAEALRDAAGITFMPEAPWGRSTRWLTCVLVDADKFGADREEIRLALEAENIESRPVWKPLHLQPVFKGCDALGGEVAEDLFNRGLCLPSGSNLTETDLKRVVAVVRRVAKR
jgi:pyridoxal phosphate-dependent aminotransferase EpsN